MKTRKRPLMIVSVLKTPGVLNALEQAVVDQCRERGLDCLVIPHLYHVSDSSDLWKKLADCADRAVLVCWLHSRPMQWILRRHQIDGDGLTILNLGSFPDAESVIDAIMLAVKNGRQAPAGAIEPWKESTGERWYPVIDASRCINCGHCLQFCLFGVYELDAEGRVAVCNPDLCKPGCPACSRICPQSAIMFPLYEKDAAIAGAPGQFVMLDAAARKMFYARTKQPCPVCGRKAGPKPRIASGKGSPCPECGLPQSVSVSGTVTFLLTQKSGKSPAAATEQAADRLPFDDLDDLVDRLDQQMRRRR